MNHFSKPIQTLVILLTAVLLYFIVDRAIFLSSAEKTIGKVVKLESYNSLCGRRGHKYNCTQFQAFVRYKEIYTIKVSAGQTRGRNQPTSKAIYETGSPVTIFFNPSNPNYAYRDSFMDIWGTPFAIFMFQILIFLRDKKTPDPQPR